MSDLALIGLIGVLVGGMARFALPGKTPGGLLMAIIVGVAGSYVAAYLGERMGWYREGDAMEFAMSAAGAFVLLAIFRFLTGTAAKSSRRENGDL
jgi:uncharacterized membrane protein YeaQ/YmgE (transglycosylase-associated protein family)